MKINTQIQGFTPEERLMPIIERKLGKLEQFDARIQVLNVVLRKEASASLKNKVVELNASIPGNKLYTQQSGSTFEAALEKAVSTFRQQILRFKGRNSKTRRKGSAAY